MMRKKLALHLLLVPSLTFANSTIDELGKKVQASIQESIVPKGEIVSIDLYAAPAKVTLHPKVEIDVWTYNGQVPGPLVKIKKGQTLKINFTNNLPQPTTIHWHGVRVPNAMDGVPGVNQDPIPPGESFQYEFTPKDAGTYWYHPHVRGAEQVERGLSGSIVVEDIEPRQYDQDIVLHVDDWLIDRDGKLVEDFVTPHDLMHDGRWGNLITVNGKSQPEIKVKPGARLRVRLINASNGRVYRPKLGEGLSGKIIAYDGLYVGEVQEIGSLELSPGNRMDLDLTVPNQGTEKVALFDDITGEVIPLATFTTEGEAVQTPGFEIPKDSSFPDTSAAQSLEVKKELLLQAYRGGPYGIEWTIDGKIWGEHDPLVLDHKKYQIIGFNNDSFRLHPMHLHGQFFQVLSRNGVFKPEPFWRDTVLVWPEEKITIGLYPQDKGTWAHHCHILEHAESGMMNVIQVN